MTQPSPPAASGAAAPAECAIGIDAGGTKTAGGLVLRSTGEVRARRVIPTRPERGGEAVLADAVALAGELAGEARALGLKVAGIGVAVAELVDLDGKVASEHTIRWRGLPVAEGFARIAPCVVEADTRAAALGEALFGAGRLFGSFFYLSIGTGIGSAFFADGRVHAGARGSTGTIATAPLALPCSTCGVESRLPLEEFASGPALVRRYNEARSRAAGARPTEAPVPTAPAARAEEVTAAAAAGDLQAIDVVRSAARALGSVLALAVNLLDPEAVILGGGLGAAGGLYRETLTAATREHIWSETHRGLPIVQAAYGADAGIAGAGAVVFRAATVPPPTAVRSGG
jgi:glucokinase